MSAIHPALLRNLVDDVKHIPRRNTIHWLVGGAALTSAVHPADNTLNARLVASSPLQGTTDLGPEDTRPEFLTRAAERLKPAGTEPNLDPSACRRKKEPTGGGVRR